MADAKRSWIECFGNYPKEYNRAVHGPYYPWVNYGPKDTPIWQVKLGELKPWLQRRNKAPYAALATVSRYGFWYKVYWGETLHGPASKMGFQVLIGTCFLAYVGAYSYYKSERLHKYHW